ncbi:hypothetical protein LJC53_06875, partial [Bacteroidales bacterium OttesenSCG-928-C03]|nr:hypothetical protein [Bacteroidales bacterium OttesenSCG-928-C03]MDL2326609.1 hypothetical protein [Bacteroidales bacterium OttesenSCG-928-A14]
MNFKKCISRYILSFTIGIIALFSAEIVEAQNIEKKWNADFRRFSDNMTAVSIVKDGIIELANDQVEIGAFCNSDCRGSVLLQPHPTQPSSFIGFLMIYGNQNDSITFKVYDHQNNKEYIALNETILFSTNAIFGEIELPYAIKIDGALSSNNSIESLLINGVEPTKVLGSDTAFHLTLDYTTSITISVSPEDENASVSGDIGTFDVEEGANTFVFTITAQNG